MMRPFSNLDREKRLRQRIINGLVFFLVNAILIHLLKSSLSNLLFDIEEGSLILFIEERFGHSFSLVFPIIIAPIYEELIFRNYLSLKSRDIAISIALYILCFGGGGNIITLTFNSVKLYLRIVMAILVFIFFRYIVIKTPLFKLSSYIKPSLYSLIIFLSSVLFAISHLRNYTPLNPNYFITYLMLLLPRLNLGMTCAYYKMNIGIWASIFLHSINNAIAILL